MVYTKISGGVYVARMWGTIRRLSGRVSALVLDRGGVTDESGEDTGGRHQSRRRQSVERLSAFVTAAACWVAIPRHFLYVPVLLSGLETRSESLLFGALLVAHVAVLSLGHPYASNEAGFDH